MHPPDREEVRAFNHEVLARRVAHAGRIRNHLADPGMLREAVQRTYRAYLRTQGLSEAEIGRLLPAKPPGRQPMPSTGPRKIFVLLIEFQDHHHVHSKEAIAEALFGRGPGGKVSVADYYDRSSYQQLDLYGGATLGWYRAPCLRSEVDTTDEGRDGLVREALKHFHAQGHDFSQYDTNRDGVVDFFTVLWAGPDTGWGGFWWACLPTFDDRRFELNGVRFGKYAWVWESRPVGNPVDPADVIHEVGHALGLPDYYDYDNTTGPPGGLGKLDMMDSAQYDHNCFSKWLLGWLTPRVVTETSEHLELGPTATSKDCALIWPRVKPGFQFGECFMAENRQRLLNDEALPGHGLVIWHVDARVKSDQFEYNNSFTEHKLLRLMEADGQEEIEKSGLADAEDFYRPGMSFGSNTVPSSYGYNGQPSGVEVSNIAARGDRISATFAVAPALATTSQRNPAG